MDLPKYSAEALANAIGALGGPGFEEAMYHWLSRVCETDNVTILAYYQDRGPDVFFSHALDPRVHAQLDSLYVGGAYLLDPFHQLHVDHAPDGLYRLKDIAPDQFQRNEYYAAYYARTTLTDELAFVVRPADGVTITICLGRDATSGRKFSARDLENAQKIAPIANALSRYHWSGLKSRGEYSADQVARALRRRLAEDRGISLSPRQSEIAFLILKGHSSVSIGLTLGISPQTVKVIRKQLYKKCTISSQAELFSLLMPYLSSGPG